MIPPTCTFVIDETETREDFSFMCQGRTPVLAENIIRLHNYCQNLNQRHSAEGSHGMGFSAQHIANFVQDHIASIDGGARQGKSVERAGKLEVQ